MRIRTRSRRGTAARLAVVSLASLAVLGLAACGDTTTVSTEDSASGDLPVDGAARELVLRVDISGGFVPVDSALRNLPPITIYSDGLVLQPAPTIMIYPGPALPVLNASQLTPAGLDALREAIASSGLAATPPDYGQPPVADVHTTTLTVVADGQRYVHAALGLSELGNDDVPGLTEEQRAARRQLAAFIDQVSDLGAIVGDDGISPVGPWHPARYRIWAQVAYDVAPGTPVLPAPQPTTTTVVPGGAGSSTSADPNGTVSSPVQPLPDPTATSTVPGEPQPTVWHWPIDAVDLAGAQECLAVEGADADAVGALVAQANQLTRFEQADVTYHVVVRPVLPDEPGCPVLGG